jgi:hypothetical protein
LAGAQCPIVARHAPATQLAAANLLDQGWQGGSNPQSTFVPSASSFVKPPDKRRPSRKKVSMPVVPVARAISLCDYLVGYSDGKVDLYGLFNAIRPENGFPCTINRFCVFAQLTNGLGEIPFFVDIRFSLSDELIWTTQTRQLNFPTRKSVVQVALTIEGCRFDRPGLYLLELFCDNTWVCDTQLLLR